MIGPAAPSTGALTPLGHDAVSITSGLWSTRRAVNSDVTLAHCLLWMERAGWVDNFRGTPHQGWPFADSEVYKLLEAAAWDGNDDLLVPLAKTVAAAQWAGGYLNTRWSAARYSDFEEGHELYCYGHLIQAAVARARTHGDDLLVGVGRRAADHVVAEFMDRPDVCGHPEIEMALVELYRQTSRDRYLELARRFVERRGRPALPWSGHERGAFYQDDVPVRQAPAFRGHAVRQFYLASGAVDVAVESADNDLLAAIEAQWERSVARRTYITGGMGSRHRDEAFGEDFELPPDRAYSETCAGIASVMLAWRLLLATGNPRYADLAERTLHNVVATGVGLDGRSFSYVNPLQMRAPGRVRAPDQMSPWGGSSLRAPWFQVSCCPSNVARILASLPGYVATSDAQGLQIHQYASGEIRHDGLALRVETGYPWSGLVVLHVLAAPRESRSVSLRVPAWAERATLSFGGASLGTGPGYITADSIWQVGDTIELDLPVTTRWVRPDPRIDAVRGCVAAERGPLVYCAESPGDDPPLSEIAVDTSSAPSEVHNGDVVELEAHGAGIATAEAGWPYGDPSDGHAEELVLRLVPYHRWANRGPASMRVWLPEVVR